jgi:hypothetical protein
LQFPPFSHSVCLFALKVSRKVGLKVMQVLKWSGSGSDLKSRFKGNAGFEVIGIGIGIGSWKLGI